MEQWHKIALGGGCHWCTEAVFQSLLGVDEVEQGYVASNRDNSTFSEAVIVHFDPEIISVEILIEIHLLPHNSTANHSMRHKYRSAVYVFCQNQFNRVQGVLDALNANFDSALVTQILPFVEFRPSREQIRNYYFNNPEKPFCRTFINPKLQLLLSKFSSVVNHNRLAHLKIT